MDFDDGEDELCGNGNGIHNDQIEICFFLTLLA